MAPDNTFIKNTWPQPYYAVIFTSQRSLSGDDIYDITSDRMVRLAQGQAGFLGVESVYGGDGIAITVSYWKDRDAIKGWRQQAEHLAAQALGREEFYDWYKVRIAEVVQERTFVSS
jgi:heme-degrading monooxygenase HmoA